MARPRQRVARAPLNRARAAIESSQPTSLSPAQGGRIPPHSLEAETAVLGAVLLSNDALNRALEVLKPADFYDQRHQVVFEAMIELGDQMRPVDLVTLAEALKAKGRLEDIGGAYLSRLSDAVATSAHVSHHARIVKGHSLARDLIHRATEIISQSFESAVDIDELLDEAEQSIFEVAEARVKPAFEPVSDVIKTSMKRIEELIDKPGMVTGVPTGFIELDRITAGFQVSDLIIIAGRPSMGKTALALNIAFNAAQAGVGVGVFSLEMSKDQLATRMLCAEARVDARKVRTGFISEKAWRSLIEAAGPVSEAPIWLDDTPGIDILEMRAKARRLKKERGIGLVVVDYLQLMQGLRGAERREQEISEISRSLKAMAKELNLPVVAISQLNRRVEDRENKRPMLADLRESGAIEQDADVIIFIYREELYVKDEEKRKEHPERGKAEVIIGKQRNGPTGVIKLRFDGRYTRFDNLDEIHEAYAPRLADEAEAPF